MDQTFFDRLEQWNEDNQYQQIIDAIEGLSEQDTTPELISQLARAYNNLAGAEDSHLFRRAVELLRSVEEECEGTHTWNFRLAYAYYYLDMEYLALPYFRKALELLPGDEDTEEFIEQCETLLAFPRTLKPFRERVPEGWDSFLAGEGQLRDLMDQNRRGGGDSDAIVALCNRLLAPAFEDICFELGYTGEKYELILTPEGDLPQLFKLVYFQNHAPAQLLEKWIITVGRTRSVGFGLRMFGQNISTGDVSVWVEQLGDNQVGLSLYCEALLPLMKENENRAYSLMAILLDQAIGELPAIRYVGYMYLLASPLERDSMPLDNLFDHLRTEIDPENFSHCETAAGLCEWYAAYQMEPTEEEEWLLRQDVYVGVSTCPALINNYYRGDDRPMNNYHQDGVVAGFIYFPLEGIEKDEILNLRDALQEKMEQQAGPDAVTFIGGATGTVYGYLDFIAWDLRSVLDSAVEALAELPLERAAYHSFRRDVTGLRLKSPENEGDAQADGDE